MPKSAPSVLKDLLPGTVRRGGMVATLLCMAACTDAKMRDAFHLRVAAVQATPAMGVPGQAVHLEILDSMQMAPLVSAAPEAATGPKLQIAWLGGCHNPPGGEYFGCYPLLRDRVTGYATQLAATESTAPARESLGFGSQFVENIPDDIVPSGKAYGVTYVFFAACLGELWAAPDRKDTVPVRCLSGDGKEVGRTGFEVGFTTIPTVAKLTNENPIIRGYSLNGSPFEPRTCAVDADCPLIGEIPERCATAHDAAEATPAGQCIPELAPCTGRSCKPYELLPDLAPESAELNPLGSLTGEPTDREVLHLELTSPHWIREETEWAGDGTTWLTQPAFPLPHPPPVNPKQIGPSSLWLIAHDGRGGAAWTQWNFFVGSAE